MTQQIEKNRSMLSYPLEELIFWDLEAEGVKLHGKRREKAKVSLEKEGTSNSKFICN